MPYEQFANNAATTLSAACTNVATSISVTSSTPFPTATNGGQFRVLIGTELLIVTAISGTTWTVTRGAEGTTAAAHSSGDAVTHIITRDSLYQFGLAGGDYFRSGYYHLGGYIGSQTTQSATVGRVYFTPFWVPVRRTFDRVGLNVNTAATAASGSVLRLGIYANSGGNPGSLILDAGTPVSTETTGAKEFTISQTLDPGLYWTAALVTVATCTLTAYTQITPFSSNLTAPYAGTSPTNPVLSSQTSLPSSVTAGSLTNVGTGWIATMLRAA